MMIELVLVLCMINQPDRCMEHRPIFEDPMTETECLNNAQQIASTYLRDHPGWTLRAWRCEKDKPHEIPT
jgi:hypothetical protein